MISEVIAAHAARWPSRKALVFLADGEGQAAELDYSALHQSAMAVAAELNRRGLRGERVLLLFPSGLAYVEAFLGCLYAGVIAVPAYPPRNNWHAERVGAIARDAGACATLTLSSLAGGIRERLLAIGSEAAGAIIALDHIDRRQAGFIDEWIVAADLAYLQYTSGSTGDPKGVMVRHGDLLANCALCGDALGVGPGDTTVSWLPLFHDMGLVHGIAMPLALGGTAVFMPPAAFVHKPVSWLRAISRFQAVFSGGPNFAYELCVAKVSAEEAATLDLASWRSAVNGAEPISPQTVGKFTEKFAAAGFSPRALVGAYGMAEATLGVTIGKEGEGAPVLWIDKLDLERAKVTMVGPDHAGHRPFASSGAVLGDFAVHIVDPLSAQRCDAARIGEIWVGAGTVCAGYWNKPQESAETFGAALSDFPGRRYLRTGDLGFMHEGQLYVTGRLKDLIIIRGANHYPQDIERTVEHAHPALRKGGWGAVFTLDDGAGTPRLVAVQEVERTARKSVDVNEVGLAVMRAITARHGIDVDVVVLVDPASVPKTSSGKIQRKPCAKQFLNGELSEIGRWQRPAAGIGAEMAGAASDTGRDRAALADLLRGLVARLGGLPLDRIYPQQPFAELGLNSMKLVELAAELGHALGVALAPTTVFDHPTIERLAAHLGGAQAEAPTAGHGDFEAVAIVGMGCRFPGADGPDEFWEMLKAGDSAVAEMTAERGALTGHPAGASDAFRWGGFLRDVDGFDAALFGISPREAHSMDPQQRLLLETAWHALESAGIAPDRLAGSDTGVFIGISSNDYFRLQREAGAGHDTYSGTGSALSIAANRISYCFRLQGPSMAIDTACSSSLVAVHQACRSLGAGESTLALAGGVNLVLSPDYGVIFSEARMLSPSGRCHTFGEGADGYVRGEGCGVVVLKLLRLAERDGDRILGVIRGSAVNQDGPSNGLTAPSGQAQQQVIRTALRRAGLAPDAIGYIETHGTGTPLGDPIEVAALKQVLDAPATATPGPCWLGAVKPNIGHLEPAAGIAGLIKTVLVLRHGQIPPVATAGAQNRHIDLSASRLRIPRQLHAWGDGADHADLSRYAGVSSFGFGGTNAHVILQAAPAVEAGSGPQTAQEGAPQALLLALSANSADSLRRMARRYAALIAGSEAAAVGAICDAARTTRAHLPERLAVASTEPCRMIEALERFASGFASGTPGLRQGRVRRHPRVAFLFAGQDTGQDAGRAGMGRVLYRNEPVFKAYIDRCDAMLMPHLEQPLGGILFGEWTDLLDNPRYAQPALVALELALADLLRHHGVIPEFVSGHGVGEYAAACCAGLFELDTALRLAALRGRLMAAAPEQGRPGMLDELRSALVAAAFHPMKVRMVACGGAAGMAMDHPDYWIAQCRETVSFGDAINALAGAGADTFVEVGPMPALSGTGARSDPDWTWIASMPKDGDEQLHFAEALAALFVAGAAPRRAADKLTAPGLAPALPPYAFDHGKYWFTPGTPARRHRAAAESTIAGRRVEIAVDDIACFETTVPNDATVYLEDHKLRGRTVMPGAAYASLMLTAASEAGIAASVATLALESLTFLSPLDLTMGPVRLQTIIERGARADADGGAQDGWHARVLAWDPQTESWESYAYGRLRGGTRPPPVAAVDVAMMRGEPQDTARFYAHFAARGLEYGPRFQALRALAVDGDMARARLVLPPHAEHASNNASVLHPVLLDAAFQAVGALLRARGDDRDLSPLPTGVDELIVFGSTGGTVYLEAQLRAGSTASRIAADLALYDERGAQLARVRGLRVSMVSLDAVLGPVAAGPGTADTAGAPQYLATRWHEARFAAAPDAVAKPWLLLAEAAADLSALQAHASRFPRLAADLGDANRLGASLADALHTPATVGGVALWLEPDSADGDAAQRCLLLCRQLQQLLAALASVGGLPAGFRFCLLTRAAASVDGEAPASLGQAGVAAMLRSAALEYPGLTLSHIDLAATPDQADLQMLDAALAHSDESQAAVRGGRLMAPRLHALRPPADTAPARIRNDGAYLVIGGTGGIGLSLAAWLVDAGAGRIVLAGRRASADERTVSLIAQWRALGVDIVLRQADMSRDAEVAALCAELAAAPTPLRGIFHAAGVLRDRPLAQLSEQDWRDVMQAKAASALLLDRHSRQFALDHFVLFSSIAASFGSAGQCNYAAANGVLDALAARRVEQGLPASSINWGPWAGPGMAGDPSLARRLARQGLMPMAPSAALEALGHILAGVAGGGVQTAVAALDWARYTEGRPAAHPPSLLRGMAPQGIAESVATPLIPPEALGKLDSAAAGHAIRHGLAFLLRQVLDSNESGPLSDGSDPRDVRLSSLGVDSLLAIELQSRVGAWVNVDLPAHMLIGNSTLEEVADLIYQKVLLGYLSAAAQAGGAMEDAEEFVL